MRLSVGDVAGGNDFRRNRQARGANAHLREISSARSDNRPSIGRQGSQQGECSGQRYDAVDVFDFAALNLTIQGFMVGFGQEFADGLDAGAPVSLADRDLGIKAVLDGPLRPYSSDGGRGVDQDTIEVEEQGLGGYDHAGMITYLGRSDTGGKKLVDKVPKLL